MFKKRKLFILFMFIAILPLAFRGATGLASSDPFITLVEGITRVGIVDGAPGPLKALFAGPEEIICGDEDAYSIPDTVEHYNAGDYPPIVMATEFGKGRVFAASSEGYFTIKSINEYDNLALGLNSIKWLDKKGNRRVLYDNRSWPYQDYAGPGDYSGLGTALAARGYTVDRFPIGKKIDTNTLSRYDVYMICTSWYTFTPSEINAIVQFVANGGGLFLTGLGWSWVLYQGPLEEYPMNKIASRFGIWFMDGSIFDPTNNIGGNPSQPLFHTFYPVSFASKGRKSGYPTINALFDSYHRTDLVGSGKWFEDHYPGDFHSSYLRSAITYDKLKPYNLFVFHGSYKPELGPRPTNDEAIAIMQYVRDGGAVIIYGEDNYWNLWSNDYPNVLAEKFGIQFNTDRVLDPTDYDTSVWGDEGGAERHIVVHNFTNNPITSGISKILLHGTCSIVVHNPNALVLASGDEDAYSDVYGGYPPGSHPPVIVALNYGKGRILFLGDGGSDEAKGYDNEKFTIAALRWLTGGLSPTPPSGALDALSTTVPKLLLEETYAHASGTKFFLIAGVSIPGRLLGITAFIDLDDYFAVTNEGKKGWVTVLLTVSAGAGLNLLPFDVGVYKLNLATVPGGCLDPRLGASAELLSFTAGYKVTGAEVGPGGQISHFDTDTVKANVKFSLAKATTASLNVEVKREVLDRILLQAIPGIGQLISSTMLAQTILKAINTLPSSAAQWTITSPIRKATCGD